MPLVESVGGDAFRNCSAIESLNFPLATTVGYSAFSGCSSLSSISIPLVENLGDQAFRICSSLTDIELPSTLTIGEGAFGYCSSLISVYAPEVLSIGANAFCDCEALTDLYIPIVEEIGDYALISCSSLTSFTIPASLNVIGVGLFNDCASMTEIVATNNDNYTYDEGILYNSDQSKALAALQAVVSGDLVLPTSVTELTDRIFYNCTEITSVELPSVTSVSYAAFSFWPWPHHSVTPRCNNPPK